MRAYRFRTNPNWNGFKISTLVLSVGRDGTSTCPRAALRRACRHDNLPWICGNGRRRLRDSRMGPARGANFMLFSRIHASTSRAGRDLLAVAVIASAAFAAVGPASAGAVTLTLYSAQHEQTVDLLTKAFAKATGIDVKIRSGEDPELASELVKEGASSPADVFFTENSPELELLSEKGLLAKVAPATLASVPAADSSANGDWVGVFARENVLAFNKDLIKEQELPASLLDLAKPEWK